MPKLLEGLVGSVDSVANNGVSVQGVDYAAARGGGPLSETVGVEAGGGEAVEPGPSTGVSDLKGDDQNSVEECQEQDELESKAMPNAESKQNQACVVPSHPNWRQPQYSDQYSAPNPAIQAVIK